MLLVRRSSQNARGAGEWELPGGRADNLLELKAEALREILEETGLKVDIVDCLGYLLEDAITGKNFRARPFLSFLWLCESEQKTIELSDEHDEYRWVTYQEALALDLSTRAQFILRGFKTEIIEFGVREN